MTVTPQTIQDTKNYYSGLGQAILHPIKTIKKGAEVVFGGQATPTTTAPTQTSGPMSVPSANAQTTGPVAPTISSVNAPKKQIYRIGGDIYDASTNQKIPNVETLQRDFAGAEEISAPTTPLDQPGPSVNAATGGVSPAVTGKKFYRKGGNFFEEGTNRYIGPTEFGQGAGFTEVSAPTTPTTPTAPNVPIAPVATPVAPTSPTAPTLPTAVEKAEKTFEEALKLSPEEIANQEELNRLMESTRTAITGEGDRPIPLEFITGRQKSIEERALNRQQPLLARAALLQAKRTGVLEASKFRLRQAESKAEITREEKRAEDLRKEGIKVGDNIMRYNPKTDSYETIYEAPEVEGEGFTLGKGQTRFSADGNVIASNVGSEGLSGGFGGAGYVVGENPTVDSWINLINSGEATIAQVPGKELKNAVANGLAAGGATTSNAKIEVLQDKIKTIDSLISHSGMSKAVGPSKLGRWTPFKIDTWTGDVQDFVGGVHQLTSKETLDYLINLKAQGGTLGALNQSELDILKGSATKINDWEIKDDNNPTGKWNISESKFKAELNKIKEIAQRALERATGNGVLGEQAESYQLPDGTIVKLQPDGTYK